MNVDGTAYRTVWVGDDGRSVHIIDQTRLPHEFMTRTLRTVAEVAEAIKAMRVRGAPLIGATAAYGVCLALAEDPGDAFLEESCDLLLATRPTAVNLRWAVDKMKAAVRGVSRDKRLDVAYIKAAEISEDDVATCASIGDHGLTLIREAWESSGKTRPVEILTHCNAGWLATVDWGTATAPIYKAHDAGVPVHVWVDETRPRNQGASLTAWEFGHHGIAHTVIVDSAGGHLMQHGRIDLCITGTDRTTASGDVCNKIGTYLKALAAHDNDVPFYVGLPHSTIDWTIHNGVRDVPIEERNPTEVTDIVGRTPSGEITTVQLTPDGSPAANFAFDVTPARLVSGLITERGICQASAEGLARLYPERAEPTALMRA
jgi:methylthioribose-1-phosphate isomerase